MVGLTVGDKGNIVSWLVSQWGVMVGLTVGMVSQWGIDKGNIVSWLVSQ